jgi:hypothetical protein
MNQKDVNQQLQQPKPEPPPPPLSERERLRARIVEIESEVERLTISMVRLWVRLNDMKKEG